MMKQKIETGGPAFPVSTAKASEGHQDGHSTWQFPGMTLRDYFIAHAPAEPQPWFMPAMPPAPNMTIWMGSSGKIYDSEISAINSKEMTIRHVAGDEYDAWRNEQVKQRYIQWPAAWADAMLKAREAE